MNPLCEMLVGARIIAIEPAKTEADPYMEGQP